jgi:hypothetical protein
MKSVKIFNISSLKEVSNLMTLTSEVSKKINHNY